MSGRICSLVMPAIELSAPGPPKSRSGTPRAALIDEAGAGAGAAARDGVPVLPSPAAPPSHAASNSFGEMQAPECARPTCRRGMKQAKRMTGSLYRWPRAFMINL